MSLARLWERTWRQILVKSQGRRPAARRASAHGPVVPPTVSARLVTVTEPVGVTRSSRTSSRGRNAGRRGTTGPWAEARRAAGRRP